MQRIFAGDVWMPSDPGPDHVQDDPPFGALQFTIDEEESVFQELDVSKGVGLDGIPPLILKNCASPFASPLSLLFNRSLLTMCFSQQVEAFEVGWQMDSVYTDFSKIFDPVHYELLLEEMSVGIKPARCLCLRSYLTGGNHRIRIGNVVSKDIRMTSCVLQEGHPDHCVLFGLVTEYR
jgi:hypothetical protein